MTTILHVAQPTVGGVPQMVLNLAAGQLASGDHVAIACPQDGVLADRATAIGAEVLPWESQRSPTAGLRTESAALRRIIAQTQPDLVHLHSAKAGLIGRLVIRGALPTVFQPQAWSFSAVTGRTRSAAIRWERYGARWAHRIVCVSETERAEGVAVGVRGVHARYAVVPNGIDTDVFARIAPAEPRPDRPAVVCVARLCRQKGQDVLLAAWPEVLRRVPKAQLFLVGDGPDADALREQVRVGRLDVEFVGAVTDCKPWYERADVVVVPSRWEGMALVPLEAMASGRAVVVTDVAGAVESLPAPAPTTPAPASATLATADLTALTALTALADAEHAPTPTPTTRGFPRPVPPDDPSALAETLATLLSDHELRFEAAAAGKAHITQNYDIGGIVERVYRVYGAARRATAGSHPRRVALTSGE